MTIRVASFVRGCALGLGLLGVGGVGCAAGTTDGFDGPEAQNPDGNNPDSPDGGGTGWQPTGDGGDSECLSIEVSSELERKPVDLVMAIDTSSSMNNELTTIQNNLNAFAAQVAASGADLRTVVITKKAYFTVPPPLGTDATRYKFIESNIGSFDALAHILAHFNTYKSFLRPNAVTHFMVVSDDYSFFDPACFKGIMEAKLGHGFTFDTISSQSTVAVPNLPASSCTCAPTIQISPTIPADNPLYGAVPECALDFTSGGGGQECAGAINPAPQYYSLARATGGLAQSICTTDWSDIFDELTAQVSRSALPCAIDIPQPPAGYAADASDVTVVYTESGESPVTFARAADANCATGQWYLDSTGEKPLARLCPATCSEVGKHAGSISIERECAVPIL